MQSLSSYLISLSHLGSATHPGYIGLVVGILLVFGGLFFIWDRGWRSENAEPSNTFLVLKRISGVISIVFGVFLIASSFGLTTLLLHKMGYNQPQTSISPQRPGYSYNVINDQAENSAEGKKKQPHYIYLVELESGRSFRAVTVVQHNGTVTFTNRKGLSMSVDRSEVKSLTKVKF